MYNTQFDIITKLTVCLEKCIFLNRKLLKNLIAIVVGMILSNSSVPADIATELKTSYSKGVLPSVVKRIQRFLYSSLNINLIYYYFAQTILKNYKPTHNKITIIFDHTTCDNRFMILQFAMKIGRRAVPLWFKIFEYKDENKLSREHVKEGIEEIRNLFSKYDYQITFLADRGFRDIDLFTFIRACGFNFSIRVVGNTIVKIPNRKNIKKLQDIKIKPTKAKYFKNVNLTKEGFVCNVGVAVNEDDGDIWYVVTNLSPRNGLRLYSSRFTIEEMFKDFKSNGFNLEGTRTNKLSYFTNLYLCLCIAYVFIITLGSSCSKDKKNKFIGAVKKTKENKYVRIYSLFKTGLKWFKLCYYSDIKRFLKCDFVLYHC